MRLNLRLKIRNFTTFFMVSSTQTLTGIVSTVNKEKHLHYLFFDAENITLEDLERQFKALQQKYDLSNIFIVSDRELSYRLYCFNIVSFTQYIHILTDPLLTCIDYNFIHWTIQRGEATLRTSRKTGRPQQSIRSVLESYPLPVPTRLQEIIYDTGIVKSGLSIILEHGRVRIYA